MKNSYNKLFRLIISILFLALFLFSFTQSYRYAYIFLIIGIFLFPYPKKRKYEIYKIIVCLVLGFIFYYYQTNSISNDTDPITVTFIDVGHGDASIIETRNHHAIMIDVGSKETADLVIQYLNYNQIIQLDTIFLSHPHEDHVGALKKVGEVVAIKEIIGPQIPEEIIQDIYYYQWIKSYCEEKNIKYREMKYPETCEINNILFECISPIDSIDSDDLNQYSLTLKAKIYDKSILYTGDIGWHTEHKLLEENIELNADILKVGHHGSYDSSSSAFIERVNPDYAIISNEDDATLNSNVLSRFSKENIPVYTTDSEGNITIQIRKDNPIIIE